MSRKAGPNEAKLKRIKSVLRKNRTGLWVREIARQAGLDKSTVSIYLEKHLADEIEDVFVSSSQWVKIVKPRK